SSDLRNDNNFTSWEVSALWSPRTYSHIKLLANSKPSESDGTGNFNKKTSFEASWKHGWSVKTSTNLGARYKNEIYEGSIREDDITSYYAAIDYRFKQSLKFGLSFGHADRDSNTDGYDYENNQFMFTTQLGL
ncbi:MAG: outer membrane beta-barrel protein, partial [Pseudomonadota bacterium]